MPATVLAVVPSSSNPAVTYEVRLGGDNNVYCTCPAWKFQKLPPKERVCKHMTALTAQMKQVAGKLGKAKVEAPKATPAPAAAPTKAVAAPVAVPVAAPAPKAVESKKAALAAKKAALAAEEAALEAEEKAAEKAAARAAIEAEVADLKAKLALAEARLSVA